MKIKIETSLKDWNLNKSESYKNSIESYRVFESNVINFRIVIIRSKRNNNWERTSLDSKKGKSVVRFYAVFNGLLQDESFHSWKDVFQGLKNIEVY